MSFSSFPENDHGAVSPLRRSKISHKAAKKNFLGAFAALREI
jgi:hypothetical protein